MGLAHATPGASRDRLDLGAGAEVRARALAAADGAIRLTAVAPGETAMPPEVAFGVAMPLERFRRAEVGRR